MLAGHRVAACFNDDTPKSRIRAAMLYDLPGGTLLFLLSALCSGEAKLIFLSYWDMHLSKCGLFTVTVGFLQQTAVL